MPFDKARLIKLLGMLGSDHDGERASAALLATRMLKEAGLVWADLVIHTKADSDPRRDSDPRCDSDPRRGSAPRRDARWAEFARGFPAAAAWLLRHMDTFEFAASLHEGVLKYGRLTPKQMAAVVRMLEREGNYRQNS